MDLKGSQNDNLIRRQYVIAFRLITRAVLTVRAGATLTYMALVVASSLILYKNKQHHCSAGILEMQHKL